MVTLLQHAIGYATRKHQGQMRKSGESYIQHLLRVLQTLQEYDLPEEIYVAAVLHDIYEDTDGNFPELEKEYGERVAFIVEALSKNQKPPYPKEKKTVVKPGTILNAEFYAKLDALSEQNFRFSLYINRFYYSVIADPWIALIKIADQLDNLRDVEIFSKKKALRKLDEVSHYFLPVYQKIEDQEIFSHMYSPTYLSLKKQLEELVQEKQAVVEGMEESGSESSEEEGGA